MLDDESKDLSKYDERLQEIGRSDWKQKLEDKKQTSDGKIFNSGIHDSLRDASLIGGDRCRYDSF